MPIGYYFLIFINHIIYLFMNNIKNFIIDFDKDLASCMIRAYHMIIYHFI